MTITEPERMMPLTEAAAFFGHEYAWLLGQCKTGRFPHTKAGRNYFMTASQIRAAQQSLAVEATAHRDPHGLRPRSRAAQNRGTRRRNG